MRVIIYYVIPIFALILVLLLVYARSRSAPVSGDDKPLISSPMMIILLGIGGAIGVFAIVFALDLLGLF